MNKNAYGTWYDALLCLPDKIFFNIMRLYLGEIKTPFNKQRLAEQLQGFLSKSSTQDIIVQSLDRLDIFILTAVKIMHPATKEMLIRFFSSEPALQKRLKNMEERLLIYSCGGYGDCTGAENPHYLLNPVLSPALEALLDSRLLFLPETVGEAESKMTVADDLILAGLYTFFLRETAVLKTDGLLRLNAEKKLQRIFPDFAAEMFRVSLLCSALQALGLLVKNDVNLIPQEERWKEFLKKRPFERKMYLGAASCGGGRREVLQLRAKVLADFLSSLDPRGLYSVETLRRLYCMAVQKNCPTAGYAAVRVQDSLLAGGQLIEAAEALHFLLPAGEYRQVNSAVFLQNTIEQPLIAEPSFEVTILPYTSFERIFPVLSCMEPVAVLTAGRFEITKAACSRCFEKNDTDETLIGLLQQAAAGALPQNIQVSISDWYLKCSAIGLYHGFVLSVAEEKRELFRQNAQLQGIICKELAEGVYLLKHIDIDTIRSLIKSAGLDAAFYRPVDVQRYAPVQLAPLEYVRQVVEADEGAYEQFQEALCAREKAFGSRMQRLEEIAESLPISAEEKRTLKERIAKKLILSEEALHSASVDSEKREVSGLDFLRKIHLAETAITGQHHLEVHFDDQAGTRIVEGLPVSIEKRDSDAVLSIRVRESGRYEKISIARTSKMVMVQQPFF